MKRVLVHQQDETDCGAACIATICKYYKKNISIPRIRNIAGTDAKGTSGKGILIAAEKLGFDGQGFFSKEKKLKNDFPYPLICHIKKDGLEHYVVIYKIHKTKILVADPANEITWQKIGDFNELWTGIFFLITPNEKFESIQKSKSFIERFWILMKKNKEMSIEILIASFILTLFGILSAFYYRYLIDEVIFSFLPSALTAASLGFLAVIILQSILSFARSHMIMFLGNKIDVSLTLEYFEHILNLPIDFFVKRKSGEILARFSDAATIKNALSNMVVGVILDSIMILLCGTVLIRFSSKLLGIAIIPVILSSILFLTLSRIYKKMIHKKAELEADKYSHFVESVNGISTIKALTTEKDALERAENKTINAIEKGFSLYSLSNFQCSISNFFSQIGHLAIYWYGSYLIMQGKMSLGELISFVTLLGYFIGPLSRLFSLQPQLQELSVATSRLGEILDLETENDFEQNLNDLEKAEGDFEIRNLSFSYGTRGKTLENINFSIFKGQKVAFVGHSGSGKSTLIKLLLKFYKPDSGDIIIDGYNTKDLKTSSYRNLIGYVPQEILLFSGTIAENIAWGQKDATFKDIVKAAQEAEALDFISKLDERFNTKVGERGTTLSGGERQRIALARILLRKPKIIVLDEATSSLDSLSESAIMKTINNLQHKTTTIIVAHRLSTIKNCDQIFVMDKGHLVEHGTHEELLKLNKEYAKMWEAQNGK